MDAEIGDFDFSKFDEDEIFDCKNARYYPGVKEYDWDKNHSLAE